MKKIIQFDGFAKALGEKKLEAVEPDIEFVGLVKDDGRGGVLINLSMKADLWVPVSNGDVQKEVEHLGESSVEEKKSEEKYPVAKFRLKRDADKQLMWAVLQDLQNSLNVARQAYEGELRRQEHNVITGDTVVSGDCTCIQGNKCCCPSGFTCCNYDKRCCCKSKK